MRPEIIRDRTLDWFDRMFAGPGIDRGCVGLIIIAVLFFGLVVIGIRI